MPLIKCHTCGKSFDRSRKRGEHCPLCDGWAGNEVAATDSPAPDAFKRNPSNPRQPAHDSGSGWNLRGIIMILAPVIVFIGGISQGKGCTAAWNDTKEAIFAFLTHKRPDTSPPREIDGPKLDFSGTVWPGPVPHVRGTPSLPDRDTVFGLGEHVRVTVDVPLDDGARVLAASTGIIASVGDQVSDQQRYWVTWIHPDISAVTCVNECDLLPDGDSTGATCAEEANWRSAQFRVPGEKTNPRRAFVWCRRAAQLGRADAMCDLGWMHTQGIGVPKDEAAAIPWYRRSAELGNAVAMNNLGIMLRDGSGVPQDDSEAVKWFRKGADSGGALAMDTGLISSPWPLTTAVCWICRRRQRNC